MSVTTCADGWFRIEGPARLVRFDLSASAPGQPDAVIQGLWIPPAGTLDLHEFAMGRVEAKELRLVDRAGKPVQGAIATCHRLLPVGVEEFHLPLGGGDFLGPALESSVSDGAGRCLLEKIPPGGGVLRVRAPGFATALVARSFREGVRGGRTEVVLQPGYALRGVVRSSKGAPLPGAAVTAKWRSSAWWERRTAIADAAGMYRIEGLPAGHHEIEVRPRAGVVVRTKAVEVPGVTVLDLDVPGGAALAGRVLHEDWSPASETAFEVVVWSEDLEEETRVLGIAGVDGAFKLADLPPGRLGRIESRSGGWFPEIRRDKGDWKPGDEGRDLPWGVTRRLDLRLKPSATVRGRAMDEEGNPVPHVRVHGLIDSEFGHREVLPAWTGEDGTYRLEVPFTGRMALQAEPPEGFVDGSPTDPYPLANDRAASDSPFGFGVKAGSEFVRDLRVLPGVTVEGSVVGWTGVPLEGIVAGIYAYGSRGGRTRPTGSDGKFAVRGVRPPSKGLAFAWAQGAEGMQGWSRKIDLSAAPDPAAPGLVVRMERPAVLEGTVERLDGPPAEGFDLRLFEGNGKVSFGESPTILSVADPVPVAAGGKFRIEGLQKGTYTFLLGTEGCRVDVGPSVEVASGESRSNLRLQFLRPGVIAGRVVDSSGYTVPGAVLAILPEQGNPAYPHGPSTSDFRQRLIATSDEWGLFRTSAVRSGPCSIEIRARGYCTRRGRVSVGDPARDWVVEPLLAIHGRVVDKVADRPLPGVRVEAWARSRERVPGTAPRNYLNEDLLAQTVSTLDGSFRLEGLQPGDYRLRFEEGPVEADRVYATRVVPAADAGGPPLLVEMVKGGSIAGRVLDADGSPVPGLSLSARRSAPDIESNWTRWRTGSTDAAGRFRIGGLPPDRYSLRVEEVDPRHERVEVEEVPVDTDDLQIRLPRR